MEYVYILQYLGTSLGVIAALLISAVPSRIVLGLALSAVSCVILAIWGFKVSAYGVAISQSIYVPMYLYGVCTWLNTNSTSIDKE